MPADVGRDPGTLFRLGVNYWPAETAMDWLVAYDPVATRRDFARARRAGLDSLRVFVRWADIQPAEGTIDDPGRHLPRLYRRYLQSEELPP